MKLTLFLASMCMSLFLCAQQTQMTIHFEFDKADIRPTDSRLLDSLAASLPPGAKHISIEIYGHCDSSGSDGYNDMLSVKRARSVKKYLLSKGVARSAIKKEKGYGRHQPMATSGNSNDDMMNRRVESVIIIPGKEKTSLKQQFEDPALTPGSNLIINNLNFQGGTDRLLTSSNAVLLELLNILRKKENLVIEIEGHICCLPGPGDGPNNRTGGSKLSEDRAKAIYDYLIFNKISPGRLSYKGYGHSIPIYPFPEVSEEQRVANRRVEIRIIKN